MPDFLKSKFVRACYSYCFANSNFLRAYSVNYFQNETLLQHFFGSKVCNICIALRDVQPMKMFICKRCNLTLKCFKFFQRIVASSIAIPMPIARSKDCI